VAAPFNRTQAANFVAYHALVTLVNLLNLPLPESGFFPHRSVDFTVLGADVRRFEMLKRELAAARPDALRGYLMAVKAMAFEVRFLLNQDPGLLRNEAFFADFERLTTLAAQAEGAEDAAQMRNLAYKLVIMLPYYEDPARLTGRNATAEAWFAEHERAGTRPDSRTRA
jgi:hypothetical protein